MTVRDVYKALLDEDENFMGYDPKYVGMFPGLSSPCIFTLCTHGYVICPVSHDQCVCVCFVTTHMLHVWHIYPTLYFAHQSFLCAENGSLIKMWFHAWSQRLEN